jgi:hypothetical protein
VSSRVNIRQRTPFVFKRKEKVIHKNEWGGKEEKLSCAKT